MAKKSSDPILQPAVEIANGLETPILVVASDTRYLDRLRGECADLPSSSAVYESIPALMAALSQFDRINLACVVLAEESGQRIDSLALRHLRLDFPQVVIFAFLHECDQRSSLRLQSVGVHDIFLPPFEDIHVQKEIAATVPNVTRFKRHPDLMRRGSARLDFLIPSDLSYVLGINRQISLLLKEFGFPLKDTRINIPLACDEAITNAIIHGNESDADKKVSVQIYVSSSRFRIRVRDQGSGFDVAEVADPTSDENLMRSSGRGVFLMRKIMDLVEYKENGTVLHLEKRNTENKN